MGPMQFVVIFSGFITYWPYIATRDGNIDMDFVWTPKYNASILRFNFQGDAGNGVAVTGSTIKLNREHDPIHNWHLSDTIWMTAHSNAMLSKLQCIKAYMRHKKIKMTHKNFKMQMQKYWGDDYVDSLKTIDIRKMQAKLKRLEKS